MDQEAGDIRSRTWALLRRHAKGCVGCQRFIHNNTIGTACDVGWELGKVIANLEHARAALAAELETPDPRLATLF